MTRTVFTISIEKSIKLLCYLILVHGVMLATLSSLLGITCWALLAFVALSFSFIYYCRQAQWLVNPYMLIKLERDSNENWYLTSKNGQVSQPLVLKSAVVLSSLMLIRFSNKSAKIEKSLVLVDDAVDAELFRQIRVYCRQPTTFQQ